jgi:hypothetical protein
MLEYLQQKFTNLQTRHQVYNSVAQMFATVYKELYVYKTNPGDAVGAYS